MRPWTNQYQYWLCSWFVCFEHQIRWTTADKKRGSQHFNITNGFAYLSKQFKIILRNAFWCFISPNSEFMKFSNVHLPLHFFCCKMLVALCAGKPSIVDKVIFWITAFRDFFTEVIWIIYVNHTEIPFLVLFHPMKLCFVCKR